MDKYDTVRVNIHDKSIVMNENVVIDGEQYVKLANKLLVPASMCAKIHATGYLVSL